MSKILSQLLSRIKAVSITGATDKEISSIESDSRKITPGALFVAVPGVTVDGHKFIPDVVKAGATAVVCQTLPDVLDSDVTYIKVECCASALGFLASEWYDNPTDRLKLVGVTGTNGKTTTATLLYEMLRMMGYKTGLFSTVCNYVDGRAVPATQTTPDQLTLNRLMHEMVEEGCEYAFMEVSSHAADQHRIDGLRFRGAIFTNLTRDHLDYHKTVDAYMRAKKRFFDILPADAFALVNADDKAGQFMLQNTAAKKYTYSLRSQADFRCKIIESRLNGTLLNIDRHEVEVLFTGRYAAKEVIQILEDEYEFAHAHTMERTVSEMCNLSQGIFEEGMEKGMAQGIERGIAQGMEKGIERGTNRERLQNIRSLMETTGWPAEQVMTAMKIPAADQPKYLKLLSLPQ